MNEVTITIAGEARTGKSTLAEEITRHLRSLGFTVWQSMGHGEEWQVHQKRRLEALRHTTTILIATAQVSKVVEKPTPPEPRTLREDEC